MLPCQLICFFVCCVFDGVCVLFGETIRNMFRRVWYLLLNVMELLCVVGCALGYLHHFLYMVVVLRLPSSYYLPYPTLQFSEEWVRGRKIMACLTP